MSRVLFFFFFTLDRVEKKTNLTVDLFYTACMRLKKGPAKAEPFYTPKRFRTAVAGMKIPSPGPLDDRGVLCAPNIDVSRKLSRVFV